ncbi:MAG: flagellar basal body P-ring protein FlgI [Nitrospinae bacterium]|nr:flagellar basal body P-ring protein FlgI [Nitrospinota bacterium]
MTMRPLTRFATLLLAAALLLTALPAQAERLKDIASLKGVRGNQLIGYGLVVGLKGSGDKSYKSPFTIQTLLSMLERLGTTIDVQKLVDPRLGVSDVRQLRDVRVENVAAVMVTASLPPFAQVGSAIDITVSSLGDARSLAGGTLLLTPLKAANGDIFAVAQGSVSVGGSCDGCPNSKLLTTGHPTVARIAGGALVEREVGFDFASLNEFSFSMSNPDFTTTQRAVQAINARLGAPMARAKDSGTVVVGVPAEYANDKVRFIAELESIDIAPDSMAKVVLDERTGTIVIGQNVKIDRVAISHGNLTIRVGDQGSPSGGGSPMIVPSTILSMEEIPTGNSDRVMELNAGASISDMVKALNAMGIAPRDLISIFQTLKTSGALQAQLEII